MYLDLESVYSLILRIRKKCLSEKYMLFPPLSGIIQNMSWHFNIGYKITLEKYQSSNTLASCCMNAQECTRMDRDGLAYEISVSGAALPP